MLKHQALIYYLFTEYAYTFGEEEIAVQEMIYLLVPFGFSSQAVRVLLSRFKSKQMVATKRKGKKSYYALTQAGKEILASAGKQTFGKPILQWNGYWRIITYNIPETERKRRDEFRNFLLHHRFGSLSNGVWICPDGIGGIKPEVLGDKIKQLDIADYVHIFQAQKVASQSSHSLVCKAYGLEELKKKYASFITKYQKEINAFQATSDPLIMQNRYVLRFEIAYEYITLLQQDPYLPKELLPYGWNGEEAGEVSYQYMVLLKDATSQYFGKELPLRKREDILHLFTKGIAFLKN